MWVRSSSIGNGEEMITTPKTPKSNRVVTIPKLLVNCLRQYMEQWYGLEQNDRIFPYTKNIVNHVMARACEAVGVKKIRVHDIRHSHASMLVELGFSPLLIAERLAMNGYRLRWKPTATFTRINKQK